MIPEIIKLLRVHHWIKNAFVFIPIIFARQVFITEKLFSTILLFFCFSLISSAVYIFNDISDIEEDKKHPQKKLRPVASGRISKRYAYYIFTALIIINLFFVRMFSPETIMILGIYFSINIFYSLGLKNIVIIDILTISLGFILRIFAGASVTNIEVSKWLILTAMFLSIFLAANKRKSELLNYKSNNITRKVLADYNNNLIDYFITITAGGLIICYALYTVSDITINMFKTENLVFTIAFVIFGVFRYLFVTNVKKLENPVEVFLKDMPTLINVILYFISVTLLIY